MAHLRVVSRVALVDHYGKWLAWLKRSHPTLVTQPPETRATPQRLDAFLQSRPDYALHSRLMVVDAILRIVQAYAPTRNWTSAHTYRKHLRQAARRSTSARKQGRILCSSYLLDLAVADFHAAHSEGERPLAKAKRLRDSTLVAFLALMPLRARALSELELGIINTVEAEIVRRIFESFAACIGVDFKCRCEDCQRRAVGLLKQAQGIVRDQPFQVMGF